MSKKKKDESKPLTHNPFGSLRNLVTIDDEVLGSLRESGAGVLIIEDPILQAAAEIPIQIRKNGHSISCNCKKCRWIDDQADSDS